MADWERALERIYPFVDWHAPIKVSTPEETRWGCPYCIAREGLRGSEVEDLWETAAEAREHIREEHLEEEEQTG